MKEKCGSGIRRGLYASLFCIFMDLLTITLYYFLVVAMAFLSVLGMTDLIRRAHCKSGGIINPTLHL